ncbi:MAG: agmatinase [Thermoleophilia bacterium]|nr:agmatinase [Thermoleophilia bacterium]MDH4338879.1 agmatinase [Thermoleophilia bacterium]MDH5279880.1 agmatinase [Thermoleophilia bacterium]
MAREDAPRYEPPDAFAVPRYTGVKTFARCPLVESPAGVDVAVLGIPFDTGTTYRPGTRFGPEAVRSASMMLRPFNPVQGTQVFGRLSVADLGDVAVTPGNAEKTMGQIAERLEPILRAGTRTLCLGGDHTVVLGELRAHAAVHGPLGLVLLDAHADVWDRYVGERYYHGSPFRRAFEEGLLDPSRSLLAGMRGSLYGPDDVAMPKDLGFEVIPCEELVTMTAEEYGARVRSRTGEGPLFLSFDIDVLDPAFAPGTGTPEAGGLSTREALGFVRSLRGLKFSGYDVVEVSPPYDGPGVPTAVAASNVAFELLTLDVLATMPA